jgi:hypothetical protein
MALAPLAGAEAPEGEGWIPLFNGENLEGWREPEGYPDVWDVEDGVIDCDPVTGPGDKALWSEHSLEDFVLHVEWRITDTPTRDTMPVIKPDGTYQLDPEGNPVTVSFPNADSGIYLRGSPKSQVNIWNWPVGSGEVWGYRTDDDMPPDVRRGVTPSENADKPVGEWNTFVIRMVGDRLTVELNGVRVIDAARLPGVPDEGPIALQHHGGLDPETGEYTPASSLVQFRNLYYKPVDGGMHQERGAEPEGSR